MANKIKVQYTEITNILNDVKAKLDDLNVVYENIKKNGELVKDSWQSEAALNCISKIEKKSDDLKKSISLVEKQKDVIDKTSKKVIESDAKIAKKIINVMNL